MKNWRTLNNIRFSCWFLNPERKITITKEMIISHISAPTNLNILLNLSPRPPEY